MYADEIVEFKILAWICYSREQWYGPEIPIPKGYVTLEEIGKAFEPRVKIQTQVMKS